MRCIIFVFDLSYCFVLGIYKCSDWTKIFLPGWIKVTREFSLTVEMFTVIFVDNKTSKNTGDENIFVWNSCTNKNLQHKLL